MSEARRAASRANGAKSRGPRSAEGLRRSSRNALKHGLAVPLGRDGAGLEALTAMTKAIAEAAAGHHAGHPRVLGLAQTMAEAVLTEARADEAECEILAQARLRLQAAQDVLDQRERDHKAMQDDGVRDVAAFGADIDLVLTLTLLRGEEDLEAATLLACAEDRRRLSRYARAAARRRMAASQALADLLAHLDAAAAPGRDARPHPSAQGKTGAGRPPKAAAGAGGPA